MSAFCNSQFSTTGKSSGFIIRLLCSREGAVMVNLLGAGCHHAYNCMPYHVFFVFFFGRRHFKNEEVLISTNQSNCSADCVIDDSFFCHLLSRKCYRQKTETCRFPTTVFQIGTLLNQSVNVMPQTRHVLEISMLCVLIKEVSSCNYCSLQPHDCMCSTSFAK